MAQWQKEVFAHKATMPAKKMQDKFDKEFSSGYGPAPAVSTKPKKVKKAAEKAAALKAEEAKQAAKWKAKNKAAAAKGYADVNNGKVWVSNEVAGMLEAAQTMQAASKKAVGAFKSLGEAFQYAAKAFTPIGMTKVAVVGSDGTYALYDVEIDGNGMAKMPDELMGKQVTISFDYEHAVVEERPAPSGPAISFGNKVEPPPEDWAPEKPVDFLAGVSVEQHQQFIDQLMGTPTILMTGYTGADKGTMKFGPGKLMAGDKELGTVNSLELGVNPWGKPPDPNKVIGNEPEPTEGKVPVETLHFQGSASGLTTVTGKKKHFHSADKPKLEMDYDFACMAIDFVVADVHGGFAQCRIPLTKIFEKSEELHMLYKAHGSKVTNLLTILGTVFETLVAKEDPTAKAAVLWHRFIKLVLHLDV